MSTNSLSQPISTAVIGGAALLVAVIAGGCYLLLIASKPAEQAVVAEKYPVEVLNTAFSSNGVFVKTKPLHAAGEGTTSSSPSSAPTLNPGDVGKTDISVFE